VTLQVWRLAIAVTGGLNLRADGPIEMPYRPNRPSRTRGIVMTQTNNRILDDIAKLMTDAAGAAQGVRREMQGVMKSQVEKMLADVDVVRREEFEAVKAMAEKARAENENLAQRVAELEARLAGKA
jgi:BMFP domain-containing protein YqiC